FHHEHVPVRLNPIILERHFEYQVPVRVADASEDINFIMDHNAATTLFKTPISEFISLSNAQQLAACDGVVNKCFTFEVTNLSPGHDYPGNFVVFTLWYEVAITL
ncbi:hypothetical protein LINGRAHAP2_LOCUS7995, partial [Linum grandiflorum]